MKRAIGAAGATLAASWGGARFLFSQTKDSIASSMEGSSAQIGHLLRDEALSSPENVEEIETVIVGGGIAGLSSGWWLKRNGYGDFKLLELESRVGGNSQSGHNEVSAYPWGAHYVPLPGPEAHFVKELFEELGVIKGYDAAGLPYYNEFYLCADPHERLLMEGRWHEGIVPQVGLSADDRRQYLEFFALMDRFKTARGRDGKRAFVIPVDMSSRDPEFLKLDQISMAQFMKDKDWESSFLCWYVNYCCRDDYGMTFDKVSAWAGIHYFASRNGSGANADSQTVLTWPEGNGWIVDRLHEKLRHQIQPKALVYSIEDFDNNDVTVDYLDTETKKRTRIQAKHVIFAAPRFVGARVIQNLKRAKPSYLEDLYYAPWIIGNITLKSLPQGHGAPLAWDNVSFHSESLGYVVATHQHLSMFPTKTVLTYYLPLSGEDPALARRKAFRKTSQEWAEEIAQDLERMHPGVRMEIDNIQIWVWGHGMIGPRVGYLWGRSRQEMLRSLGRIHFAHTDMSGISIFEEAQCRGIQAANQVLAGLGRNKEKRVRGAAD